jgi:hypothetical protein
LLRLDREIAMGDDPADILHQVLGTEAAAHFLSFVYVAWIVFIPLSLAAALVWTRDARRGIWYVTAVSFDWMLGAATYYLVPSVGPIYERPGSFAELPDTASSRLAGVLLDARLEVLADPHSSEQVQTIAAFASLHVGILVTAALSPLVRPRPRGALGPLALPRPHSACHGLSRLALPPRRHRRSRVRRAWSVAGRAY